MILIRRNPGVRTILVVSAAALFAALLIQILWLGVISPRLPVKRISLESDLGLSDNQLLEMLDLDNETWATVDERELQERLESYPVVRKARVVKVFPDTLRLYLYRRRPLAVTLASSAAGTLTSVFDEEGYAVQIGGRTGSLDLPVLSGVVLTDPVLGAHLPDVLQSILGDLSTIRSDDPRVFALISEVGILPDGNGDIAIRIFLNQVPIPVLVDRPLTVDTIRRAVLVLDVLESTGEVVHEADMRGGNVVFRRMEGIDG